MCCEAIDPGLTATHVPLTWLFDYLIISGGESQHADRAREHHAGNRGRTLELARAPPPAPPRHATPRHATRRFKSAPLPLHLHAVPPCLAPLRVSSRAEGRAVPRPKRCCGVAETLACRDFAAAKSLLPPLAWLVPVGQAWWRVARKLKWLAQLQTKPPFRMTEPPFRIHHCLG